jgi:hypothetical protein
VRRLPRTAGHLGVEKPCDLCQNTDGIEEKLVGGGRAEIGMTVSREKILRWWEERVQKPRLKEKASEKGFALVKGAEMIARYRRGVGPMTSLCCAWECGREWMMPFNFDRGLIVAGAQQ